MEIVPRRQTINITPRSSPWEMNDDVFLVDLTRPVVAATKVTRAPAKLGRLIPLSRVVDIYWLAELVGMILVLGLPRRPIRLGAFSWVSEIELIVG